MIKAGSLFSGIGAFEEVLSRLNLEHEIEFACDNDKWAKQTYLANFQPKIFYDNVFDVDYSGELDLLVGGSPCQSFSRAGKRDFVGISFVDAFIKVVNKIQPKVFIFENTAYKNACFHIQDYFRKNLNINGKWECLILNAKNFGLRKLNRERFFIIFHANPIKYRIFDLISVPENPLKCKRRKDLELKYSKTGRQKERIYDADGLMPCLSTDRNEWINFNDNEEPRRLTPRECLDLMEFNKDFIIHGSNTQQIKQIGNSINVAVLKAIFRSIYE